MAASSPSRRRTSASGGEADEQSEGKSPSPPSQTRKGSKSSKSSCTVRCSQCGRPGHNSRTCPDNPRDSSVKCSLCGGRGHNRRTCAAVDGSGSALKRASRSRSTAPGGSEFHGPGLACRSRSRSPGLHHPQASHSAHLHHSHSTHPHLNVPGISAQQLLLRQELSSLATPSQAMQNSLSAVYDGVSHSGPPTSAFHGPNADSHALSGYGRTQRAYHQGYDPLERARSDVVGTLSGQYPSCHAPLPDRGMMGGNAYELMPCMSAGAGSVMSHQMSQQSHGSMQLNMLPGSDDEMIKLARNASYRAWLDNKRLQTIEWHFPGQDAMTSMPSGSSHISASSTAVFSDFETVVGLTWQLLRQLKQIPGLQGSLRGERIDRGAPAGQWVGESLAAIVRPASDHVPLLQHLADTGSANRLVLAVNPVVRAGFHAQVGGGQNAAFAQRSTTVFAIHEYEFLRECVKVMRVYPSGWQVFHAPSGCTANQLAVETSKPSIARLMSLAQNLPRNNSGGSTSLRVATHSEAMGPLRNGPQAPDDPWARPMGEAVACSNTGDRCDFAGWQAYDCGSDIGRADSVHLSACHSTMPDCSGSASVVGDSPADVAAMFPEEDGLPFEGGFNYVTQAIAGAIDDAKHSGRGANGATDECGLEKVAELTNKRHLIGSSLDLQAYHDGSSLPLPLGGDVDEQGSRAAIDFLFHDKWDETCGNEDAELAAPQNPPSSSQPPTDVARERRLRELQEADRSAQQAMEAAAAQRKALQQEMATLKQDRL